MCALLIQRLSAGVMAAGILLAACGGAEEGVAISDAVYRPPLGSSGVGVAYGVLSSSQDDKIVSVSSPYAVAVEMHESISSGGSSRMQRIDTLQLHVGESVVFSPGGRHFMVIGPDPLPLTGEPPATFPIQFQFESGRKLVVGFSAEVTKP